GMIVEPVEDVAAFPIARRGDVVMLLEEGGARAEEAIDLGFVPDVELALLVLAVGVEAAAEAAFRRQHLAHQPVDRLGDALGIKRASGVLPDERHQRDELGVVVEHLLEMRRQPARVDSVAGEAAARMLVDGALAHAVERMRYRVAEFRLAGALPRAP